MCGARWHLLGARQEEEVGGGGFGGGQYVGLVSLPRLPASRRVSRSKINILFHWARCPKTVQQCFVLPVYGTQHEHQQSGYTKPKLDDVLCQGIPFSDEKSMSVHVTKVTINGKPVNFVLPVYGTKK